MLLTSSSSDSSSSLFTLSLHSRSSLSLSLSLVSLSLALALFSPSQMRSCTTRKMVPKLSNQIVGLKKASHQEEDDDVADVFKI